VLVMSKRTMEPAERKLLGVFVREALSRPGEDTIITTNRNPKTVKTLRSLGYVHPTDDSLTREGFLAYFETLEEFDCPHEVQQWVDRFGIVDIHWRKPSGVIKN